MPESVSEKIVGVILAGGLARRLGNVDKALVQVGQTSLLEFAVKNLEPQCDQIIINANGNPERFQDHNTPIIPDTIEGHLGPLAGVLAAMEWAQQNAPQTKWIVTLPVDTPFAPSDLTQCLMQETSAQNADMACASSGGRLHPVVGLWPINLAKQLRHAIINEDMRKVDSWTSRYKLAVVNFDINQYDPFFNVNRPDDIETAQKIEHQILKEQSSAS